MAPKLSTKSLCTVPGPERGKGTGFDELAAEALLPLPLSQLSAAGHASLAHFPFRAPLANFPLRASFADFPLGAALAKLAKGGGADAAEAGDAALSGLAGDL